SNTPLARNEVDPTTLPKEPEGPKRQPKANTCVGLAVLHEQAAADPNRSPVEKTELLEKARRAYQQALKGEPNHLPALKGLAHLYVTLNDHEKAVATYRRAIQAHPKNAELHYLLGMCHAQQKEWQPALEALRKALDLEPENRQLINAYGLAL